MSIEKCTNCFDFIGKLEKAYLHNGNVVCQKCNDRLRGAHTNEQAASDSAFSASNQQIKPIGKHSIFYYVFWGTFFLFGILVILWLGIILADGGKLTNIDRIDPQPGQVVTNSIGIKLVWIPPGEFQMGSNDDVGEKPIHTVKISKGFYMGIFEVTQRQYRKVIGNNPSKFKGGDNRPVEMVSWFDSVKFCKTLSKKEGKAYRLPTEIIVTRQSLRMVQHGTISCITTLIPTHRQ
jgi:formylglycine-generating enzyme required for sulfatase activity